MGLLDHLKNRQPEPRRTWKRRPEVLLSGQIPKPMHGLAPRVVLGAHWWNQVRFTAYRSTEQHCIACGIHRYGGHMYQWLEGHELYDIDYLLGRMTYLETVPLCHFCHSFIHFGRVEMLVEEGKIARDKMEAIKQHCKLILRNAKLVEKQPYSGPCADWQDWRLVIDGKEYAPLYSTFDDWARHYRGNDDG